MASNSYNAEYTTSLLLTVKMLDAETNFIYGNQQEL